MFSILYTLLHFYSASRYYEDHVQASRPFANIWYEDINPYFSRHTSATASLKRCVSYVFFQPLKMMLSLARAILMFAAGIIALPISGLIGGLSILLAALVALTGFSIKGLFNYEIFEHPVTQGFLKAAAFGLWDVAGNAMTTFMFCTLYSLLSILRMLAQMVTYPLIGTYLLIQTLRLALKPNTPQPDDLDALPDEVLGEIMSFLPQSDALNLSLTSTKIHSRCDKILHKDSLFVVAPIPFLFLDATATPENLLHAAYRQANIKPALALFNSDDNDLSYQALIQKHDFIDTSDYALVFKSEVNATAFAKKTFGSSYLLFKATEIKSPPQPDDTDGPIVIKETMPKTVTFWDTAKNGLADDSSYRIMGNMEERAKTFHTTHSLKDPENKAQIVSILSLYFFAGKTSTQKNYQSLPNREISKRMEFMGGVFNHA